MKLTSALLLEVKVKKKKKKRRWGKDGAVSTRTTDDHPYWQTGTSRQESFSSAEELVLAEGTFSNVTSDKQLSESTTRELVSGITGCDMLIVS